MIDPRDGPREALERPPVAGPLGPEWWREGVVYQIYPRSFADSDGDGVGDLPGIIDRLDHLGPKGLGVDAIWLSPIYPSPGRDVGYDVSDHTRVDGLFGTEQDFDRLVDEAHKRGLRVVLDLVMNHTSDEHPWFEASRRSRDNPYADWYLWRDPAGYDESGRPQRPNNWVSFFGGPAWTWEPSRGQFYQHTFLREQPDLNWRNPAVEAAQFDMVRGWLERGVDGFRLDVFNVYLKHPDLPSNPSQPGPTAWTRQVHLNDRDQPDFVGLVGRLRELVDAYPATFTIGELFDGGPERAAELSADRHLVFDWELLVTPWSAEAFGRVIDRREVVFGPARWPALVLSNHDQPRHASRLARSAGIEDIDGIAKAAALILLGLRGTPFLYYGEEIGMVDVPIPDDEIVDPPAKRTTPDFPWWNRDQCRTPMPWTAEPGAGFTTGRPWIRLGDDHLRRNVAAQSRDPDSVLACYRRLLAARRSLPALRRGSFHRILTVESDVLAWERTHGDTTVAILVNFATSERRVEWADPGNDGGAAWRTVAGTSIEPATPGPGGEIVLRGLEGIVLIRA